jgi:H+/Cl- antiporter ClcA
LFLMLAAMIYYILSGNLSRWPYYIQPQHAPSENSSTT